MNLAYSASHTPTLPWASISKFLEAAEAVPWANDTLTALPIPEHLLDNFCTEKTWRDYCQIDLSKVRGTRHPDYQEFTWLEFLNKGKRMRCNLEQLFSNPGYYFTREKKRPSMSYLKIGDHFYVHHDGNHRTCIARFLYSLLGENEFLTGVEATEVVVDFEAYNLWRDLGGPRGLVTVFSVKIGRNDGPGWMTERFKLNFSSFWGGTFREGLTKDDLRDLSKKPTRTWLEKVKSFFNPKGYLGVGP